MSHRVLLAMALAASLAGGCRRAGGPATLAPGVEPTGASAAWSVALVAAQSDADRGRHAEADRTLREFAAEHARSAEATETTYWRAVFMLDPANTTATARDAATLLERYLATNAPLAHRAEASVLQRIAKALAAPREAAPTPPRATDAAREAELKALKDELEQTKAELERIKKRVAPPPAPATPPPPLPDPE